MLKVLVLCLLNSSIRIPCTKQGVWSKLRGIFLDNSSDIYQARNVSFMYCLCTHAEVCAMDTSNAIDFKPLCPCWRYDHNRSWPHFQLQEASKDDAERKDVISVHLHPCSAGTDSSDSLLLARPQPVIGCARTLLHNLQDISLRETLRLCTWTERRLRAWQSVLKTDDGVKTGGRFRRGLKAAGNLTETDSTSPSLAMSPYLLTPTEHSGTSSYSETSKTSFIDDGASAEVTAFIDSLDYWHQSLSQVESPTTGISWLPGSDGITAYPQMTLSPSLSDGDMGQTFERVSRSSINSPSDFSDLSSMSQETVIESAGSEIPMEASDALMLLPSVPSELTVSLAQPGDLASNSLLSSHRLTGNQSVPPTAPLMEENAPSSDGNLWSTFYNNGDHSVSQPIPLPIISAATSYDIPWETSTSSNPTKLSSPSPIFPESSSMSIGLDRLSESSDYTSILQSLASSGETVKESDNQSRPVDYRVTLDPSVLPTLSPVEGTTQVSVEYTSSAFNNQVDNSGSSLISQQIISATQLDEMALSHGTELQSPDSSGIAMRPSISPTASITEEAVKQTTVGYLSSTMNLFGDLAPSTPVPSASDFVLSDVSFEHGAPSESEQIRLSSVLTLPVHQAPGSSSGDQSFSVYSAVTSDALDPSLTNALEAPFSMQPTPVLEISNLPKESSDTVPLSNSGSFDLVGSETKLSDYFQTNSENNQWLTSIIEESSALINFTESSLNTMTYSAMLVKSNKQTSLWLETPNQMDSFSPLTKTSNMEISGIHELLSSSESADNLSPSTGLHTALSLFVDTTNQSNPTKDLPMWGLSSSTEHPVYSSSLFTEGYWPLRTYIEPTVGVSTHTPEIYSSSRFGLNEPLTTSVEPVRPDSFSEYQPSTLPGLEFLPSLPTASSLHDSQRVTTEQYPSDLLLDTAFLELSSFLLPASVSLAENVTSVNGLVTETRVDVSDSEIVIDGLRSEALSATATAHLPFMTGSIFDLAGNGLYTAHGSVAPTLPSVPSFPTPSTALAEDPASHSPSPVASISHYYSETLESSLHMDLQHSLSSFPFLLSRSDSLLSGSDDGKVEFKETALQTGGILVSMSSNKMQIFSSESFEEAGLKTLSQENADGAPFEKSVSLPLPVESAEKFMFTSLEDFHFSQRVTVTTKMPEDSAGFDRPGRDSLIAQISTISIQQTLQPDYTQVDSDRSEQFVWDTHSLNPMTKLVPASSTEPSTGGNEHTLHHTTGVSSSSHHISDMFPSILSQSTASVRETTHLETHASTQRSEETFLFTETVRLSETEIETLMSVPSAEKSYSEGISPSSLISVLNLSDLMTSAVFSASELFQNSLSTAEAASVKDVSDPSSASFSTSSFSSTVWSGTSSDSLSSLSVWLSAGSSLFSPTGVRTEPHSSTASQLSLSPSSVRMSVALLTDSPERFSAKTSIDTDSYLPRSELQPTASSGRPAVLQTAGSAALDRGTLLPSPPPSQSRTPLPPPSQLTATISQSLPDPLDLASVIETAPLSVLESNLGRTATVSPRSPVSFTFSLTQFTAQLSPTAAASSFLENDDDSVSVPTSTVLTMKSVLGVASQPTTHLGPTNQPTTQLGLRSQPITQLGLTSQPITQLGPTSQPITQLGLTSSQPITQLGLTSSQPITQLGLTSSQPITQLGPTSQPITQLGPTSQPTTQLGLTSSQPITQLGLTSQPITQLGLTSSQPVTQLGSKSQPITQLGLSSQPTTQLGLTSSQPITQLGLTSQPITQLGPISQPITQLGLTSQPITQLGPTSQPITQLGPTSQPISQLEPTSQPITQLGLTSQPITQLGLTSQPITQLGPTSQPITQLGLISQPITQLGPTSQPITQLGPTSQPITQLGLTSQPITQLGLTSQPITQLGPTSQPITQRGLISQPITQLGLTSQPITQLGLTSQPITQLGPTSQPITQLGPTSQPVTQLGPTSQPITQLGPTSQPITQLGPTSQPITQLGLTSQPITQLGPTSQPITQLGLTSVPITQLGPTSQPITQLGPTSQPITQLGPTSQPITQQGLTSGPSSVLSVSWSSSQLPLSSNMLTSTMLFSLADSTVLTVMSSYSTPPVLSLTPFPTDLPTPALPTSKTSSAPQPSMASSSSVTSSRPASSSPVSATGAQTSAQAPATQPVSPPGPVQPNGTAAPAPPIQQEHLLQITLQVNSTVDIFQEAFLTALSEGLLLTFLQASQLNQTSARADPLITVEIYSVSRLSADSVLVQFVVLEDGKPMRSADVLETLNRLPDLLGTLNENLPYPVTVGPEAVEEAPLAELAGWLAGVVVLAVLCLVLVVLLAVFVKKAQGRPSEALPNIQKRALTPFKEGRLRESREPTDELGSPDAEGGGASGTGSAPHSPEDAAGASRTRRTPPRAKRPVPLRKPKRRRRRKVMSPLRHHQVTPLESSSESAGDQDTGEHTPAGPQDADGRYEGVGQAPPTPPPRAGPRFQSTVAPLPPLQPQRLAGHQDDDEEGEEEGQARPTGSELNHRGPPRKEQAQPAAHRASGAVLDRNQQRRAEAEHSRNKKRLREKQRQAQRDSSPLHRHGHGDNDNQEGGGAKRRSKAARRQAESDLAAWRRVQAQISSLLEPEPGDFNEQFRAMQGALAFPRGPAHLQGYSHPMSLEFAPPGPLMGRAPPFPYAGQLQPAPPQLPNSFGPWAQPWQKAPIPNTRHNAEFLRSLQPQPPFYPAPAPAPPPHPSFYPQPSGLADELLDEGSSAGPSHSTEAHSPPAADLPGAPLLSPGSHGYLQQLVSLNPPRPSQPQGKRRAKTTVAKDDGQDST